MANWTFLSNHGHAILYLAANPDARMRDIAEAVGITERATQRIIKDLTEAGFASITREGRRNSYSLDSDKRLRHPLENSHSIGELIVALAARE